MSMSKNSRRLLEEVAMRADPSSKNSRGASMGPSKEN